MRKLSLINVLMVISAVAILATVGLALRHNQQKAEQVENLPQVEEIHEIFHCGDKNLPVRSYNWEIPQFKLEIFFSWEPVMKYTEVTYSDGNVTIWAEEDGYCAHNVSVIKVN